MGTIRQGILGPFSGKVGTVIGSVWKGIACMRGIAPNIRNPKTQRQREQRGKFSLVMAFLSPITAYLNIGYKTSAKKQSAVNVAMRQVLANAVTGTFPDYTLDYTKILVSRGSLTQIVGATAAVAAGTVTATWTDNGGNGSAASTDRVLFLAYNIEKKEAAFKVSGTTRADGTITLNLPSDWAGKTMHLYLTTVSEDGKLVSDSLYLGSKTAATLS